MKIFWKNFISIFVAVAMIVGCFPAMAVSAGEISESAQEDSEGVEDVQTDEESDMSDEEDEEPEEPDDISPIYGPEVDAECAVLMDASTGAILYSKNPDRQMYPASITKIMTCMLALENCSLDETVVFSADAVYKNESNSSHIARDLDEEMTMEETLYAVMLESANECAYAVAEHVGGGDYQTFIEMMNDKAEELGCTNTHFTNANGLPDEEHITSARDMALIAQEAIKDSEFREIIGTTRYVIPPTNKHDENTYLNNHNKMINDYKGSEHLYEYCIGGKTGYTEAAGNTLVTYAEKDGTLLICVILRSSAMYDDSETLYEWGFDNFETVNIAENETRYGASAGSDAIFDPGAAYVALDPDAEVTLPIGASFNDTTAELSGDNASEDLLGTLNYYYEGRYVGSADVMITGMAEVSLEATDTVESDIIEASSPERAVQSTDGQMGAGMKVLLVMVIILVALIIIMLFITRRARRRRARLRKKKKDQRK